MGAHPKAWVAGTLLFLLVAAAAVVLLWRPTPPGGSLTPSNPEQGEVEVSRADIRSVVVLEGAITAAPTVGLRSPITGAVTSFAAAENASVKIGDPIAVVRDANGKASEIVAEDDGILLSIDASVGQQVHAGEVVATLAPHKFEAVATVDPVTLYRLYQPPISVRVQLERGPAPFACSFISLQAEVEPGANPFDAPVTFRCAIPDIRVFPGIRARIAIVTAEANGVLAVPVGAVEGSADSGWVTLRDATGHEERRSVTLGITDGINIEIRSGLREGDVILNPPSVEDLGIPSASG
jgi:multidrug efflux pump subunit AcrA (membrane-fusion protein)